MHMNVKRVFDEECKSLRFDTALTKRLNDYQVGFVNKNEEHMSFFGGNLLGVQKVRFLPVDKDKWFNDVLGIDDITIEERLLQLPDINANFHISSDVFNLSVMWVIHSLMNSHLLNDKQKQKACMDAALSLQYKFLTSLMAHYIRFNIDPEVAAAAYAQLSYKYAIKQYGSWSATLTARCESLLGEESIHYTTLKKFNSDLDIVYLLNDTQSRIRDMLKNIYGHLLKVNKDGGKITSTSNSLEHDGESILKDKTKSLIGYTRYLHSITADKNSFIKQELLLVIKKVMYTMPSKQLDKTLDWFSSNYRQGDSKDIDNLIDLTLTHSFGYLKDHKNLLKETNDLASLVSNMRGVYMSSRSTDTDLLTIRKLAEGVVSKATGLKNDNIIASVRTGLLLYLVLRAYTLHHYS